MKKTVRINYSFLYLCQFDYRPKKAGFLYMVGISFVRNHIKFDFCIIEMVMGEAVLRSLARSAILQHS